MTDFLKEKLGKMYDLLPPEDAGKYEKVPDISTGDMIAADQEASRPNPRPNKVDLPKVKVPYLGEFDTNVLKEREPAAALGAGAGIGASFLVKRGYNPPAFQRLAFHSILFVVRCQLLRLMQQLNNVHLNLRDDYLSRGLAPLSLKTSKPERISSKATVSHQEAHPRSQLRAS